MGAVSRDIYRNGREYDATYAYTDEGIAVLLKDIYRMNESRLYKGDIDATAIITDLKTALDSDCLTPRMRQVVALYYFVGLTRDEITEVLGVTRPTVIESSAQSLERIANEMMNGQARKRSSSELFFDTDTPLNRWLTVVGRGELPVYNVPDYVFDSVLEVFRKVDSKASETLKQRSIGAPVFEPEDEEYPALSDDQFRWRDRRMTFVSDMKYSNDRLMGYRRLAYDSETEVIEGRQKLYKIF